MGRIRMELELRVGEGESVEENLAFTRDVDAQFSTLGASASDVISLVARTVVEAPLSDVTSVKLLYVEADGDFEVAFNGIPGIAPTIIGEPMTEPSGFEGGESFLFVVDQSYVMGTFTANAQSVEQVVEELNLAASATYGLTHVPFSVEDGAIRVTCLGNGSNYAALCALPLAQIGFPQTQHQQGTDPIGNPVVHKVTRPAAPADRAGLKAVFFSTIEANTVAIKNPHPTATINVRVCVAGNHVAPPEE